MQQKLSGSFAEKGATRSTQEKSGPESASPKRKSVSPAVSFGYNSMFADDEHIVRHSLSSVEGMPVLDAEQITEQAEALHQQRAPSPKPPPSWNVRPGWKPTSRPTKRATEAFNRRRRYLPPQVRQCPTGSGGNHPAG
jgi:hypothetical protein